MTRCPRLGDPTSVRFEMSANPIGSVGCAGKELLRSPLILGGSVLDDPLSALMAGRYPPPLGEGDSHVSVSVIALSVAGNL